MKRKLPPHIRAERLKEQRRRHSAKQREEYKLEIGNRRQFFSQQEEPLYTVAAGSNRLTTNLGDGCNWKKPHYPH